MSVLIVKYNKINNKYNRVYNTLKQYRILPYYNILQYNTVWDVRHEVTCSMTVITKCHMETETKNNSVYMYNKHYMFLTSLGHIQGRLLPNARVGSGDQDCFPIQHDLAPTHSPCQPST